MKKKHIFILFAFYSILTIPILSLNVKPKEPKKIKGNKEVKEEQLDYATISKPIIDLQITLSPEIKSVNENKEKPIDYVAEYNEKLDLIDSYNEQEWFIAYKLLQDEYSKYIETDTTIYETFSSDQITYMQRCIETEVYQAPFDNKCNVASVILNRVTSDRWSSNPTIVITSKNQFAYFRTNITESTILALEYAYQIGDTTNGCVAFRSGNKPNSWIGLNLQFVDEVGHGFYK